MTTLQVRLSPAEMARLIDGEPVEIHTNDRTVVLVGSVPDWQSQPVDDEAREAQAAYDDLWL